MKAAPRSSYLHLLLWLPPLVVGVSLRLVHVTAQVLGGDELHSVRMAMSTPVSTILTRHTEFDHGRPLTALFRILLDAGVVFSELTFRLPSLVAGGLLLLVAPLLFRRRLEHGAALFLAWLLALSPVLVLYSRMVRTYMPVLLLAFVAVMSFYGWWSAVKVGERRWRRWLAGFYVIAAALAVWGHLLVVPFVLAPFVFAFADLGHDLWRRRKSDSGVVDRPALLALRLAGLLGLTAAVVAVPHLFTLESLAHLAGTRGGRAEFGRRTLLGTLGLQSGTSGFVAMVAFWCAALAGAWIELRRRPRFFAYAFALCALQIVTIVSLAPKQSNQPLVFNRYVLVALPFVLAWIATAMATAWNAGLGARRMAWRGSIVAGLIGLFAVGPLAGPAYRNSSFTQHNRFVDFSVEKAPPDDVRIPEFYRRVAGEPDGRALLEFPWNWQWNHSLAPFYYQAVHGQDVVVAGRLLPLEDRRFAFQNAAPLARKNGTSVAPDSFLASRARYLVVHLDMAAEELRFRGGGMPLAEANQLRADGGRMASVVRRRFGPPLEEDDDILVWDLDALRAANPAPTR